MARKLYGLALRTHVALLGFSLLVLVGFVVLAVLSATLLDYSVAQWAVAGFLMIWACATVAWEVRVLVLFRTGRADGDE